LGRQKQLGTSRGGPTVDKSRDYMMIMMMMISLRGKVRNEGIAKELEWRMSSNV